MKDHYKTLGVSENATEGEIKSAYHKLAKKMHPDLNPGNKEIAKQFQEVSSAYNTLSKKESRDKYDQERKFNRQFGSGNNHNWNNNQYSQGSNYQSWNFDHFEQSGNDFSFDFDLSNLFNMFRPKKQPTKKSKDIVINVKISFLDSVLGIKKEIKIKNKQLNINIPPGANDGDIMSIPGRGSTDPGKVPGDLKIKLNVESDPIFQRKGHDIYIFVAKDSIKDGTAIIPTIYGTVKIKVPSPIPNKIKLQGKGIRNNQKIGDQYIVLS